MGLVPVEDVLTVYTQTILPSMPEWDAESEESDGEDSSADNFAKPLEKYLDYFEATWLGAINKRTNVRGKPRFEFELWNKYSSVLSDQPDLTSNRSEAWNSAMKICLPRKPGVWVVCKAIREVSGNHHNLNISLSSLSPGRGPCKGQDDGSYCWNCTQGPEPREDKDENGKICGLEAYCGTVQICAS